MDFSKLFKLGDKNILEDAEEKSLEGKEDEEIRKIILDNFPKLFPHLELYSKGNEYTMPVFKKTKRPDSLAFCESEKRLYIFEYKSKIDENLVEQVRKYRDALQKSDSNLFDLILKWNKQTNKHRGLEDFRNNKAKIICIAPEFDDYAIGVEAEWEEEIYLIKITKYKNKGDFYYLLQSRNSEILNLSTNDTNIKEKPKPQWINKLKEWISQEVEHLSIDSSWFIKDRRGGGGWDLGKINQEAILSICYRSFFYKSFTYFSKPKIFLVNPSEFLIRKWQLKGPNEWGSNFYFIETEANDGFERAKNLLTDFIKEKNKNE